jgi:diguanylate cyclase (GGDEF)-like protein
LEASKRPAAPPGPPGTGNETPTDAKALWEEFEAPTFARIAVIESAAMALMEGSFDAALRREAHAEAHKLGGTLGMLGFARGSQLAKTAEHLLAGNEPLGQAQALRLSELAVDLRNDLERSPLKRPGGPPAPAAGPPTMLLVNDDRKLAKKLTKAAAARGIRAEAVAEGAAWEAVTRTHPDVVVLDLTLRSNPEGRVALLSQLASCNPPVPAIVLTERGEFVDRVEIAKLGARGFLQKPLPPSEILGFVVDLLDRLRTPQAKILAVNDDAQMLVTLRMFLEPKGVQLVILEQAARFWQTLEGICPDLLVLDVAMQGGGIELCRMVRKEARWRAIPILLLSASNAADTAHRAYAAGADDFVGKAITSPELVTRILNRLERVQSVRSATEMDALTGLATSQRLQQALRQYFRLADRYRQPLTLGLLEVDEFEALVGRHGGPASDAVMRRVGEILMGTFRGEDVLARGAGAEFAMAMFGMNKDDGVRRLTEVLYTLRREAFATPDGTRFHVTATAGIAEYPTDGDDWTPLYTAARRAVDQGRAGGGGAVLPSGGRLYRGEEGERVDVVVVDDDAALATLLLHALETRGYRARWLQDGESAVEMLGGASPLVRTRLVLLDVGLPGLDGLSVLRRLGQDGVTRHTRVIMVTARTEETEILAAFELGAFDHVAKPFSLPVLLLRIRRALEPEPVL